ncbi:MAG: SAM-dependent methyltransferase [Acidimicrobiales bacterium]
MSPTSRVRFDRFMERCLYGPGGFYSTTGTAGRRGGDFLTNPEVGPLFGAVVAEMLDSRWIELGSPDDMVIYDVGCGPGALLKAVAAAKPDRPWRLVGVDRVESAGADISELPDDLSGAVVLGNELLDNLPFRIVERRPDGFYEVFVTNGPGGDSEGLAEHLQPTDLALDIPVGTRAPLLTAAGEWLDSVIERGPAMVCLIDYGAPTTAELAARGGWLRTYRQHQRGSDPYLDPGTADITTDVAWDQLAAPASLERQHEFLRRWGIDRLVDEGRDYWKQHAAAPDLTAMRMRSRISEVDALVDSSGLGNWWVATWQE